MTLAGSQFLPFFLAFFGGIQVLLSFTDPRDVAALQSLKNQWQNIPSSWNQSDDPCGTPWEGVACNQDYSRVNSLDLSNMGLIGKLGDDIGELTELLSIDLSFNPDLTGPLPPRLGGLQNLSSLVLSYCGFSGSIPNELGDLAALNYLDVSSNNFTGRIPPSLGKLSKLYWLDMANNQLIGSLPVSTSSSPGLDLLLNARHFGFDNNQLSGPVPHKLFSSGMGLIHLYLDDNQISGSIPPTLGLVQSLEILRLDNNALTGHVPSNLNSLTFINELSLSNNKLTGPLPNLTQMHSLKFLDLSNNSFDPSEAPAWLSTLPLLTTLYLEYGTLQGSVPTSLFSSPQIWQVYLKNNAFNGTLNMGERINPGLSYVDLQSNQISSLTLTSRYKKTLKLAGNPVCSALANSSYC